MTTRRSFLTGLLATAAAPPLPAPRALSNTEIVDKAYSNLLMASSDLNEAALERMDIILRESWEVAYGAWANNIFNHGFNADGDGIALFSTPHPDA